METTWRLSVERGIGEKVQGISTINGRYKIDSGKLRTV